jgi:hypothetical protein
MLYIENLAKNVITLKAFECSDIRLFPGFNEIDVDDQSELEPYLNNPVVQGHLNGYEKQVIILEKTDKDSNRIEDLRRVSKKEKVKPAIRFVELEELDEGDLQDAIYAREKNEMLNKSGLTIKKQAKTIEEKSVENSDQQKQIDELKSIIDGLTNKLKEAGI